MPSTYNNALRIEEIANGEQSGTWGTTTNKNLAQLIVQAVTGTTSLNVTSGNITLTALDGLPDESRSAVLSVTGTPGVTRVLTIPNVTKLYTVLNATANIVQVKTASGSAFDCPPLSQSYIICNGSNVVTGRSITDASNTITSSSTPFTSPVFSGTPTAPTAAIGTNTTQLATTAFVNNEIANDAPTKTGTGASGTWGISITGNAVTATSATSATSATTATTAINATNVAVTTSSTASAFKVPFANTTVSTTGNYGLLQDDTATFTYNPSTNTLTAGTFSGALSGNATSATNATTVTSITSGQVTTALGYTPVQQGTGIGQLTNIVKIGWSGSSLKATVDASDQGSFAFLSGDQTFTGAKTFTGTITSTAYNMAAFVSMYGDTSGIQFSVGTGGINNVMGITSVGNFNISGSNATKASGTTWINPSDARLKDNVVSYTKGLNELVQIQPKSFTFNGKAGSVAGLNAIGIIADEIEQVLPNTVQKRLAKLNPNDAQETEIRYFDASELTWVMVNAIKELKAEFDAYKATHP